MELLLKKPKTARGMTSLKKIIDSTKHLIGERGYFCTTVEDIMKNANMATGTFYIYFNDKMSAYEYCLKDIQKEIRNATSKPLKESKTRKEAERNGLIAYLNFIREHQYAYKLVWQAQFVNYDLFKDYYETFSSKYMYQLEKYKKTNEVKDHDSEVMVYMLMGISNFIGIRYEIFNEDKDIEELADEVIHILRVGMFN